MFVSLIVHVMYYVHPQRWYEPKRYDMISHDIPWTWTWAWTYMNMNMNMSMSMTELIMLTCTLYVKKYRGCCVGRWDCRVIICSRGEGGIECSGTNKTATSNHSMIQHGITRQHHLINHGCNEMVYDINMTRDPTTGNDMTWQGDMLTMLYLYSYSFCYSITSPWCTHSWWKTTYSCFRMDEIMISIETCDICFHPSDMGYDRTEHHT